MADLNSTQQAIRDIVDKISSSTDSKVVFGEAIQQDNTIVIPVSKHVVSGGAGGGEGTKPENENLDLIENENDGGNVEASKSKTESGSGIGFGFSKKSVPMGYIWMKDGDIGYEEIIDKQKMFLMGLIGFGITITFLKTLAKLGYKAKSGK